MDDVLQGSASIDSALDGLFASVQDSTPTGNDSAGDESIVGATDGQTPDLESAQPDDEQEEITDEEVKEFPTNEHGARVVPKNRWDRAYSAMKRMAAMNQELGGEIPPVAEIKRNADIAADTIAMQADIASGDPDRASRFLGHWLNDKPEALPAIVESAITGLRETSPEQFQELQGAFNQNLLGEMYTKAAQMRQQNHPDFKDFAYAIQVLDWALTGDYKDPNAIQVPEPLDERLAELRALEQSNQDRSQRAAQASGTQFQVSVNAELVKARTTLIDTALSGLKESYANRPKLFASIQESLKSAALEELRDDRNWRIQFNTAREQAIRTRDPRAARQVIDLYQTRLGRAVKANARAVIREATDSEIERNRNAHGVAASASARREPGGGGRAMPINAAAELEKAKAAKNVDGALDAIFSSYK